MTEENESLWASDSNNDPQQRRLETLLRDFSAEARGLAAWKPADANVTSGSARDHFRRPLA